MACIFRLSKYLNNSILQKSFGKPSWVVFLLFGEKRSFVPVFAAECAFARKSFGETKEDIRDVSCMSS